MNARDIDTLQDSPLLYTADMADPQPLVNDPSVSGELLLGTLLGFDMQTCQIPLDALLPSKKVVNGTMSTRKYKQVVSSIREIGLIEPLSVIQTDQDQSEYLVLDGHLRNLAL